MYRICKRFSFDAAHRLDGLPDGHKCGRTHGHTYAVEVELSAHRLDQHGFVVDFGDLSAVVKGLIDQRYDHQFLNDKIDANPTAENLAFELYNSITPMLRALLREIVVEAVRVSETPSSWAEYRP
jgi:6-pyruvoyltetrahydropterin/6-carboxytetrahydropterin synthase